MDYIKTNYVPEAEYKALSIKFDQLDKLYSNLIGRLDSILENYNQVVNDLSFIKKKELQEYAFSKNLSKNYNQFNTD